MKTEIKSFGQDVDKGGSLAGKAHRAWMDVKAFVSNDNAESMLEEAIRGEKSSLDEYCDVLKETSLPLTTKDILNRQKNAIQNDLSTINGLEDLA